jgi:hypothetical protein
MNKAPEKYPPPIEGAWYWLSADCERWWPGKRESLRCGGWTNDDTWEDFDGSVRHWLPIPAPGSDQSGSAAAGTHAMAGAAARAESTAALSLALRIACEQIRRSPLPLADLIPIMQRAADALDALAPDHSHEGETPILIAELCPVCGKDMLALQEALAEINQWAEAYPLDLFPEPDFKQVAAALSAAGITLDCVSASNMRHVIVRVRDKLAAALQAEPL